MPDDRLHLPWFTISVDTLQVPRVVCAAHTLGVCKLAASSYWNNNAAPGERVFVAPESHPLIWELRNRPTAVA